MARLKLQGTPDQYWDLHAQLVAGEEVYGRQVVMWSERKSPDGREVLLYIDCAPDFRHVGARSLSSSRETVMTKVCWAFSAAALAAYEREQAAAAAAGERE
jgi:hypothetical protein